MPWTPPPSGKRGRQCQFSDAAIQTCLTIKVLFGLPLRQTTGFVESLLKLVGLDWAVPDFSTLCRRQKALNVSLPYRGGNGPLNLLIDSTGIKAEGEGEWSAEDQKTVRGTVFPTNAHARRSQTPDLAQDTYRDRQENPGGSGCRGHDQHCRRRAHAAGTAEPNPVRSGDWIGDRRRGLRHAQVPRRDCRPWRSRARHCARTNGAQGSLPPRKNAKPWKPTSPGAIARNEAATASRYLGRALWRRWSGYHRRSRVETKMHCVKLLGQSLMARDFDRQVAEIQVRIAVLNRYTALGIPVTEPVG